MIRNIIEKYLISKKLKIFFDKNLKKKSNSNDKIEILMEFNAFSSTHIYLALIANFLSGNQNLNIKAFRNYTLSILDFNSNFFSRMKFKLANFFGVNFFGIYKSLGVRNIISPFYSKAILLQANEIYLNILKALNSKESVYNVKFDNVIYGDLLVDGFLKENFTYILDIKSKKFKKYLFNFICLYLFWKNYFQKNKVHYVLGVHNMYSYGMILRLALFNNIEVLTISTGRVSRYTKKRFFQNHEWKDYKTQFANLNKQKQKLALSKSKEILDKKFKGKENIRELWNSIGSFSRENDNSFKILNQNSKLKIFVATHNVKDAINAYGPSFFPDYYEWLNFLSKISDQTDYEWYIKDHPFYGKRYQEGAGGDQTAELSKFIVNRNEKFFYIPSNIPNNKLINEGINFVTTLHGSVAYEYAYFDIPVLNANTHCPTRDYDFNIHSKNLDEYEKNLLNLKSLKISINKDQILQYYFMRYIFNNYDCFNNEHSKFVEFSSYDDYDTNKFYRYLLENLNKEKIKEIEKVFNKFIVSNDYCLNSLHCDPEFNKIV